MMQLRWSRRIVMAVPFALAVGACATCSSDRTTGPATDRVRIRLTVTGGIGGVSYAFIVDGDAGVVRGETCDNGCSFEPGEILVPVSTFQVRDLVERFEDLGFLGLDGTDFGQACCDWFDYVLEYDDGRRSASVRGSGGAFPAALLDLADRIHAFGLRIVPAVVAHDSDPARWPRDPLTLDSLSIDDAILTLHLAWSGGCAHHSVDLVAWGGFLESNPVQLRTLLAHDDRADACDAFIRSRRSFDLQPIQRSWREAYGSDHGTVLLRLTDPATGLDRIVPFHF